eukprot:gnl/TRDRNA2_/TRDRNA2_171798_c0_seq2.p1 gnl/TRDRNA2_/TRDRNA2_171798_c0~~gnl/TRDRNA2_/TRDRNA2_171798_c0_seq2.p1  ORF type:complete len:268 (-),score=38.29 gnl/TRDRNA2_/TRDRNA2_171798_c0_seq2:113-916(-)
MSCGLLWFLMYYCMVLGVKMSDAITFGAWQPLTPVVCSLLSVIFGYEKFSRKKASGVLIASGGALMMTLWDSAENLNVNNTRLAAHFCFVLEVICYASFIIRSKALLVKYSFLLVNMWVMGLSFLVSSCAVAIGHYFPAVRQVYCQNPITAHMDTCLHADLEIPTSSIFSLVLFQIVLSGFFAHTVNIALTKFLKPSVISGYTAVQPICIALLSTLHVKVLGREWAADQGIKLAEFQHMIGTLIIVVGLAMVCSEGSFDEKPEDVNV